MGLPSPSFQEAGGQKPRGRLASLLGIRQSPSWPPFLPYRRQTVRCQHWGAVEGHPQLADCWGAREICKGGLTSSRTSQLGQGSLVLMLRVLFPSPQPMATVCKPSSSKPTNTETWENDRPQRKGNHKSHSPADPLRVHASGHSLKESVWSLRSLSMVEYRSECQALGVRGTRGLGLWVLGARTASQSRYEKRGEGVIWTENSNERSWVCEGDEFGRSTARKKARSLRSQAGSRKEKSLEKWPENIIRFRTWGRAQRKGMASAQWS